MLPQYPEANVASTHKDGMPRYLIKSDVDFDILLSDSEDAEEEEKLYEKGESLEEEKDEELQPCREEDASIVKTIVS